MPFLFLSPSTQAGNPYVTEGNERLWMNRIADRMEPYLRASGINVTRYKYLATVLGGGISAIGGVAYITGIAGCVWNHEGLSGVGWLAVALVIFCLWKPSAAIWGSILFGCLQNLYLRLSIPFIPSQIYKILPYIVTVLVLIFSSLRNNREKQPPAALGVPYFREER